MDSEKRKSRPIPKGRARKQDNASREVRPTDRPETDQPSVGLRPDLESLHRETQERERAEAALKRSERDYRNLFECAHDAILIFRPEDEVVLEVNQRACDLYGFGRSEFIGMTLEKITKDVLRGKKHIETILDKRMLHQYESVHLRKDGSEMTLEINASVVNYKGQWAIQSIHRDITERKRVEEALQFTRVSLDHATDMLGCVDREARYIDVNRAFCRNVGYSREELLSMTVHDINPDYHAEMWLEFWERLKQAGSLAFESRHRTKDGRIIPVEIVATFFEHNGKEYHSALARDITGRKRIEEALKREQDLIGRIAETSPAGITVVNRHGQITYANDRAERVLGLSKDEITQRTYNAPAWQITDYDGQPFPDEKLPFQRVMATGQPVYDVRHAIEWPDGRRVFLSINASPLFDGRGQADGMVATVEDVTDRVRTEEGLKESEEKYRLLVENSQQGILVLQDGKLQFANPWVVQHSGYSLPELTSRPFLELVHPEDRAMVAERYEKRLKGEKIPEVYPFRFINKQGRVQWVEANSVRIPWKGRPAALSFLSDITERKRAEEALRESEEHYRTLVENQGEGIGIVDQEERFVFANPAAEVIFGVPHGNLVGRSLREFTTPEQFAHLQAETQKRRLGEKNTYDVEIIRPDGERRTLLLTSSPQFDPEGRFTCTFGIFSDISERKRVEEALRESEAMSRAVIEHSPVGISIRDHQGVLLQVNEAWKKIWAMSDAEIQENEKWSAGRSWKERCPYLGDSGQDVDRLFDPEGGVSILYLPELEIQEPKPGAAQRISMYLYALRNEAGQVEKVVTLTQDITERKRSEAAMRESQEKYRLVVENASDAILVAQDGMMKFVNHRVQEITGYSEGELTSRPFPEFIHPEDRKIVVERHQNRLQGKPVPPVYPFRIVTKAGEDRWVEIRAVTIPWQGKPATLSFLTDITERRKAEEALRKSEAKYRELVENANSIILRRDPEGRITFFNEFAQRFFGFREEEILGRNIVGTIVPEKESSGRDLAQMIRDISRHPERYAANENENVLRNGERVWVAWTNKPILDPDGKLVEILCIGNDITERKRAEEALEASEVKYRTLVEGMSEAVMQVDNDDRVQFVNPQFCQMMGYREDELLGRVGYEIYFDPEEQEMIRRKNRLRLEKTSDAYETRMRKKNGEEVLVRISGSPVADALGNVAGSIGVITDITEHKLLEAEFLQAQKMEALGRLAGGVAHDFNNLLTSIMGYSDLLAKKLTEDDPSGPLRRYADSILSSANRAANLTQQLLSLSRRHAFQMQVLDLNVVVTEVERVLRGLIREDIELTTHAEGAVGRVKADPVQIEQVLMNLAVNARDAMPCGGRLSIRTANVVLDKSYARRRRDVAPGPYVMIAVSDTGHGMDAEVQSHLFEPFFTTKEKGKGTGLGLSTAYGIVKQMGGHIDVESAPGKGSAFKIYLPRTEETPVPLASPQPQPVEAELPRGVETVLLAEDEETVRSLARDVLRDAGYTVLEAGDGEEALRVAGSHPGPIHLLLTDVIMPRLGGPALARHLQPLRPDMRVLFMSGYTDGDISSYGGLGSETSLLQKPFQPMVLARRVREVLEAP